MHLSINDNNSMSYQTLDSIQSKSLLQSYKTSVLYGFSLTFFKACFTFEKNSKPCSKLGIVKMRQLKLF